MGGSGGGVGRGDGGGGGGDERPFLVRLLNGDPAALARARGQGESEPAERSGRRVARRSFGPTGDAANRPGRPRRTRRLPESLAAFPGLVAIVAGRDLTERYAAALLPFGLNLTEFLTLSVIGQRPGLSLTAASERLALSRSHMSEVFDALHEVGLVEQRTVFRDRRRLACRLTESGADTLADACAALTQIDRSWLAPLPEGERERFCAQLLRVVPREETAGAMWARVMWT